MTEIRTTFATPRYRPTTDVMGPTMAQDSNGQFVARTVYEDLVREYQQLAAELGRMQIVSTEEPFTLDTGS